MGKNERGGGDDGPGLDPNGWMITFSDLLTLMLTFFVLLFSMSSLDAKTIKEMTQDGSTGGDGVLETGMPKEVKLDEDAAKPQVVPAKMVSISEDVAQYLRMVGRGVTDERRRNLEQRILERGKQDKMEVNVLPNGIEISFEQDQEAFANGRISAAAKEQLRMVADAVVESGARVKVETTSNGDDLNSWMVASDRASLASEFIRRHSGIANKRTRIGVAPKPLGQNTGRVRMTLQMPKDGE